MNTHGVALTQAAPIPRATSYARRMERPLKQTRVVVYDGSHDLEVCCIICGAFLGRNSNRWWDDYICTFCHDAD